MRTARQVINALNAQGSEIDIILSEVDLPVAKGFKMLKYIMRIKELRHIPIVSKFLQFLTFLLTFVPFSFLCVHVK